MTINLCFHGLGSCGREREAGESRYWVPPGLFLRIADLLPENPHVRLTFDDGNSSDLDLAVPALAERGLNAEFFPLAGRLGRPGSLSAAGLRDLRAAGMPIGSHGWDHVSWRTLRGPALRRELWDARAALEAASGGPVHRVALPLGQYDRRLLRTLKGAGVPRVYTSDRFPARAGSWLQARYSVTAGDTLASVLAVIRRRKLADARHVASSLVKRAR